MSLVDVDGLDTLARRLSASGAGLRLEADRLARTLAGLGWSGGVAHLWLDATASAIGRLLARANDLDALATEVHTQADAVNAAIAEARQLAGHAASGISQAATDVWHAVTDLL